MRHSVRYLAAVLFALAVTVLLAAEVETRTYTVDRVKGTTIYTQAEVVFKVDPKTRIVKKSAKGEVDAKLADIVEGTKVEIHTEKGAAEIKKIVIQ